jgi:nucleoside-diphosphate-sugar epimerase
MNIFITGEKGFIARNLIERSKNFKNFNIVTGAVDYLNMHQKGEPCVYQNSIDQWQFFFELNKIDVIIHNAAAVGTDVVALDATQSTRTNVEGTYNICRAAKALKIPICYIGTTVIYDTVQYQETEITEQSKLGPHTLYGCQKLCAEDIVKSQTNTWMIVRPLFAYGGEGDMNSLIAKTIYASLNGKKKIDMFLDMNKIKDYMHVYDFADGVLTAIEQQLWMSDWNIAAETPCSTRAIVKIIEKICNLDLTDVIQWHPKTDYLGNHRLSSKSFRGISGWSPSITLGEGIEMSFESILKAEGYNPLEYLEYAKNKNIDLTKFY